MRRIADGDDLEPGIEDQPDRDHQHELYRKTLEALVDVDADDENEGVAVVTGLIVEQLEAGTPPSSKAVRRRGRELCRQHSDELPDDSWLGEQRPNHVPPRPRPAYSSSCSTPNRS